MTSQGNKRAAKSVVSETKQASNDQTKARLGTGTIETKRTSKLAKAATIRPKVLKIQIEAEAQENSTDSPFPDYEPSNSPANSYDSSNSWVTVSVEDNNLIQPSTAEQHQMDKIEMAALSAANNSNTDSQSRTTQQKSNKNLFKYLKRLMSKRKKKSAPNKLHWTTEDAFFAVIGGYAVRSDTFWPSWDSETLTFTHIGIIELARLGLLTKADPETVSDKSKADVITKVIVCIQASWYLFQCIARAIQGLSVTLLEVHVLAHVACTFVMYYFWFYKPYNVDHPVLLTDERVVDLAALFAVAGPEVCNINLRGIVAVHT